MSREYWLSDEAWARIEPFLPEIYAGARRKDDRPDHQRDHSCAVQRMSLAGLSCGLRSADDDLQSLQPVEPPGAGWRSSRAWAAIPKDDRSIDSTSIRIQRAAAGGKGGHGAGDWSPAGGRTTKIHAIGDSKGRLLHFLLTPGHRADVTAAHDLTTQLPGQGCLIGDTGYDARKLRQDLAFRGIATAIPTIRPENTNGRSISISTSSAIRRTDVQSPQGFSTDRHTPTS